jgi:hypothetical protein
MSGAVTLLCRGELWAFSRSGWEARAEPPSPRQARHMLSGFRAHGSGMPGLRRILCAYTGNMHVSPWPDEEVCSALVQALASGRLRVERIGQGGKPSGTAPQAAPAPAPAEAEMEDWIEAAPAASPRPAAPKAKVLDARAATALAAENQALARDGIALRELCRGGSCEHCQALAGMAA